MAAQTMHDAQRLGRPRELRITQYTFSANHINIPVKLATNWCGISEILRIGEYVVHVVKYTHVRSGSRDTPHYFTEIDLSYNIVIKYVVKMYCVYQYSIQDIPSNYYKELNSRIIRWPSLISLNFEAGGTARYRASQGLNWNGISFNANLQIGGHINYSAHACFTSSAGVARDRSDKKYIFYLFYLYF